MTKKDLESVVDGLAELIGEWNQAAEDGDRGAANDALVLTIMDDGSGSLGKRGWGGTVDEIHQFDNAEHLAQLLGNEGAVDDVNHFTNIQGPQKCPRRCTQCPDGNHHWMIVCFPGCLEPGEGDYDEALTHPAVQAWIANEDPEKPECSYFVCKHCEAWHELTEAMMDDPDFEIV